jgi:hypothetical protein
LYKQEIFVGFPTCRLHLGQAAKGKKLPYAGMAARAQAG